VTNSLWYYLADPEPAAKLSALSSLTHLVLVGMVKANIFLPDNSAAAAAAAAASVPTLLEPECRLAVFACLTYTAAAAAAAPDPEPAVKLLALSSLTHLVLRGMVKASVVLPDIHCCRCCCCCVRP
jgi:hypothetical protein